MYDEELEQIMLRYMIFDNEDYILDENDFVYERNKKIIKAINELKAEKQEISMFAVRDKIKANKQQVLEYLVQISDSIRFISADDAYNKIIEMSKKRNAHELITKAQQEIIDAENIDIYLEQLVKSINQISSRNEKIKTFVEQVAETSQAIEDASRNKPDYSLYTGLMDLDKIICGLHNEELTIIGARPGVGKTTLALQIADNIANAGVQTAIISLEMSDVQIIQKILARKTRINSYKMRMGTLEEQDLEKIGIESANIAGLPIHLITNARTIQQIENIARKLKNRNNLGLIIIDYIQLIKNKGKFNSREQEVADITRTLKLLSLELKIPIVGLCQLNRNANKSEPSLADLRESGAIEQDADNVIFIYQEKEDDGPVVDVTIKVAKQRAGGTGKVYMKFVKANSEFRGVMRC